MTLPVAAPITAAQIAAELGASGFSFTDTRVSLLAGKTGTAPPLSMADFLGKTSWRAAGTSGNDADGQPRIGFSNVPGASLVTGTLSPQAFKSDSICACADHTSINECFIEFFGVHPQNYFFAAIVNNVPVLAQNAVVLSLAGPRTRYVYTGQFGLVNGAALNVEIFY